MLNESLVFLIDVFCQPWKGNELTEDKLLTEVSIKHRQVKIVISLITSGREVSSNITDTLFSFHLTVGCRNVMIVNNDIHSYTSILMT